MPSLGAVEPTWCRTREICSRSKLMTPFLTVEGGTGSAPLEIKAYSVDSGLLPDPTTEEYVIGAGTTHLVTQRIENATRTVSFLGSDITINGVTFTTLAPDGTELEAESVFGHRTDPASIRRHEKDGVITETFVDISNGAVVGADHSWDRTETITTKASDGQGGETVVSVVQNEYHKTLDLESEVLDQVTENPGGPDPQVTQYAYHEDPASPQLLGKLDWVKYPNDDWSRSVYDANGRSIGSLSPWLDGPADPALATVANCRYSNFGGSGGL